MQIKIGTFNAQNLFLRYKFLAIERGSRGKKVDPTKFIKEGGNINMLGFDILKEPQRRNTASVILENNPDVICLQEVENFETLKEFNAKYLGKKYQYGMLVDGNDIRQIDVGVLSRFEIGGVKTHQFDKDDKGIIFSRDCLEADISLDENGSKKLTLFVNHLKSKLGGEEKTDEKRERQAKRIYEIVENRFGKDIDNADFCIVGDFNDTPDSVCLKPLLDRFENAVGRLPKSDQLTYYFEGKSEAGQFDYILLSRALLKKNPNTLPTIERRGLANYAKAYQGPRFPGVGPKGTEASDHCPVFIEINV